MREKVLGVIPARLGSTRLAEKVLRPIQGKPMVQHVWERAAKAQGLDELVVACDDPRIADTVKNFGGKAVLTRVDHPNGSSRVSEAASKSDAAIVINIQGDEPTMRPEGIDSLCEVLRAEPALPVATLAVRRQMDEDYENPNVVKVVLAKNGDALYFSRSPLPYFRDKNAGPFTYLKHLGIYGYRKKFLLDFVKWPVAKLEDWEKLEQLRILEQGHKIRVVETPYDSWSVDTSEDLALVEQKLKA